MSTLKVNNLQDTNGANNSTPEQVAQGRAKAWINFNGTGTIAILDSFGISSITDRGTGKYTITYSTAFANSNYSFSPMPRGNSQTFGPLNRDDLTTTNSEFDSFDGNGNRVDRDILGGVFFGDV
tara:strand:+ start:194 stop:565 length:372 start_codon:yes stop_codon:yes gene_type:complete